MKKFLLRTVLFISFSAILYVVLIVLFGAFAPVYLKKNLNFKRGSYGHMYSRLQDADTTSNVDILFLGSSHAYRGYDPRIFRDAGFRVFNLGSSAQTPVQTELLLNRYLHRMNPKLVVFDVYPGVLGNEGVESSLDLIANGPIDRSVFRMALNVNNTKVYNTLIYGYCHQAVKKGATFTEAKKRNGDTYIDGGYVETYRRYKPVDSLHKKQYTLLTEQVEALDRILGKLKAKNIKVLLVQTPVTVKRYQTIQNNAEMDSLFRKRGMYYNFNQLLALPDSMFLDDGHLNQLGVNVFNPKLVSILQNNQDRGFTN